MRLNPDGSPFTFVVTDRASGKKVTVDDRLYDPKLHKLAKGASEASEADEAEAEDTVAARKRELKTMPADEVKEIAVGLEIEYTNKDEAIEAILEAEAEG